MATLIYQGIKYVSDSNGYFKDKHNNNYLKFRPNITFTVSNITLSPHLDYYVKRYTSTGVDLSLSHVHNTTKFVTITINDFNNKGHLNMPPAKIRFCPNAPELAVALDGEGYYTANGCKEVTSNSINLINASTLVTSDWLTTNRFKQLSWRINDLKTGVALTSWTSVNLNNTNYAATYPDTEIRFIAEWGNENEGKSYTISYWANGREWKTESFSYSNNWINLTTDEPAHDNTNKYSFVGWALTTSGDDVVDNNYRVAYNTGSQFSCHQTNNVKLYAKWVQSTNWIGANKEVIFFNNGGGYQGQGTIALTTTDVWKYPGETSVNASAFTANTGVPKRRGYSFAGWINNEGNESGGARKWPGQTILQWFSQNKKVIVVDWTGADTIFEDDSKNSETWSKTHSYQGHIIVYKIKPNHFTKYTIYSSNSNQILRITNSIGEVLTFLDEGNSAYVTNTPSSGIAINLQPGDYQLEIVAGADVKSTFTIKKEIVNKKVTVDPTNNGEYDWNGTGGADYQKTTRSHDFSSNNSYVGISSVRTSTTATPLALTSFNGGGALSTATYMGEPTYIGGKYQFKEWITSPAEIGKISPRTLSGKQIYTTSGIPFQDFSVKATWKPNTCYVIYNGNGATSGYMSNSEHLYGIASPVFPNNYQKITKIIFNSRGGTYSQSSDWNDSTYVDADSAARTMTITHLFNKWSTNANGTGISYDGKEEGKCGSITFTDSAYGATKNLYAIWNLTTIQLPKVERAGFDFMGWYKADGSRAGGAGDSYAYGDTAEITLYAHWEPIGLVQIYTDDGWKYAIPYVYDGTSWKRAMQYTYNGSAWKQGAGSGQNMTDEQLENL